MKIESKDFLSKIGKVTLPAVMLASGAWNVHASVASARVELSEQITQEQQNSEIQSADADGAILVQQSWNFDGSCYGCEGSCGGCTGACTGCSGGCSAGCTGCMGNCEGTAASFF